MTQLPIIQLPIKENFSMQSWVENLTKLKTSTDIDRKVGRIEVPKSAEDTTAIDIIYNWSITNIC